jgi:hypothetical protein
MSQPVFHDLHNCTDSFRSPGFHSHTRLCCSTACEACNRPPSPDLPPIFAVMTAADGKYVCLGQRFVLTKVSKLSEERAEDVAADYNDEVYDLLAQKAKSLLPKRPASKTVAALQRIVDAAGNYIELPANLLSEALDALKEEADAPSAADLVVQLAEGFFESSWFGIGESVDPPYYQQAEEIWNKLHEAVKKASAEKKG